ncbi:hypothetical protein CGMCC3_g3419 [Colletotrichum fructicola]|nr:uncharacterized protein CGMCC3_g3419 [Colletotrichum fructicola]KAE9580419.1 hypothetical protein CGMCC3_g3419 [Colletotrichum fructicola]
MAQSRTHPVYMESIATRCPSRRLEDLQVSSNGPGKYSIILSESTAGCPSHQAGSGKHVEASGPPVQGLHH